MSGLAVPFPEPAAVLAQVVREQLAAENPVEEVLSPSLPVD